MTAYQMIGIAGSGLLALAGIVKFELIRAWVKKLTDSDTAAAPIAVLIMVSVVPAIAGFTIPEPSAGEDEPKEEPRAKRTTKEGEIIDATTQGVVTLSRLGAEIAEQAKEDKEERRDAYQAQKRSRWAYKIGDAMTSRSAIVNLYQDIKGAGRISLFKEKKKYFFFLEQGNSRADLEASLQEIQDQVGDAGKVEVVDLSDWTSHRKPNIVMTDPIVITNKKKKIEISCFVAEN